MRSTAIALGLSVLAPLVATWQLRGDDTVINTPVVTSQLHGEWELQPKDVKDFRQRLSLGGSVQGSWQQSRETLPVTIAWFVEGAELRIFHYYEPSGAFNYRVKDLTFAFKMDKDTLTLTRGGVTQTWKRLPKAAEASP